MTSLEKAGILPHRDPRIMHPGSSPSSQFLTCLLPWLTPAPHLAMVALVQHAAAPERGCVCPLIHHPGGLQEPGIPASPPAPVLPCPSCSKSKPLSISDWTIAKLQKVLRDRHIPFARAAPKAMFFSLYVESLGGKQCLPSAAVLQADHVTFPTATARDDVTNFPDASSTQVLPSAGSPQLFFMPISSVFPAVPYLPFYLIFPSIPGLQLQALLVQLQFLLADSSFSLYTAPPAVPPGDARLFNPPFDSSAQRVQIPQGTEVSPHYFTPLLPLVLPTPLTPAIFLLP
ncbi:hypothetical protein MHYP_G00346980 [Metynnis hypsauchen]